MKERFLSPTEFRRLALELDADEAAYPAHVAIVRLLIYTGARVSEIRGLQWDWVQLPRLLLPDSKTAPKTIYLNSQAVRIFDSFVRKGDNLLVFPGAKGDRQIKLDPWWPKFRRRCALPDVRIHDLRHSFASVGVREKLALATIGSLLGHVLPETTARYAHLADDTIAEAAQRVSGGLAGTLGLSACPVSHLNRLSKRRWPRSRPAPALHENQRADHAPRPGFGSSTALVSAIIPAGGMFISSSCAWRAGCAP
jgi:integrase